MGIKLFFKACVISLGSLFHSFQILLLYCKQRKLLHLVSLLLACRVDHSFLLCLQLCECLKTSPSLISAPLVWDAFISPEVMLWSCLDLLVKEDYTW